MPIKATGNAELLKKLLSDERRWAAAAEILRDKLNDELDGTDLTQQQILDTLGKVKSDKKDEPEKHVVSQPTMSRFLRREPTPRLRKALLRHHEGLGVLLAKLGLPVSELMKQAVSQGLLLCIDRLNDELESGECPSIRFRAAEDQAIPIPMDPRTDRSQTICRFCQRTLSAVCQNDGCDAQVDAGSYCPKCGYRYIKNVPEELRGLTGMRLVRACEKRNAANQAARHHPESGLPG